MDLFHRTARRALLPGMLCISLCRVAAGAADYPAKSPGLNRPSVQIVVAPPGLHAAQYNPGSTRKNLTVDLRRTVLWANRNEAHRADRPLPALPDELPARGAGPELYPLNARPVGDGFWFVGGTVIGQQHRGLPWRFVKQLYDGDALRFEGEGKAVITVHGLRADNVQDGVSPRVASGTAPGDVYWKVHGCYFRYVRDDVVENDSLLDGEIVDCLVDGAFVFLSQRPGARSTNTRPEARTRIQHCLVRLEGMPYDQDMGGDPAVPGSLVDGKGHGMPFKFRGPPTGRIEVRDTVFLIDGLSVNGPRSMNLPSWDGCVYENVTIVWRGGDRYPGELPARGVTVTNDLAVWTRAREAWLAAHPGVLDGL